MKKEIYSVHYNRGFDSINSQNIFHCSLLEEIPNVKKEWVLYYIELKEIARWKSHFNEQYFFDFEIQFWSNSEAPLELTMNSWKLDFLELPRGRGVGVIKYKFTDSKNQELILRVDADTRYPDKFCQSLALIKLQFEKASIYPSLNHHLSI
jgi:hypothetical protein